MNAEHLWMDQGIQTFRLRIVPHADTWKERNIPVLAEEFLTPALCIYQGIHGGKMPKSGSFLSTETPNVIISSVKQAEFGKDTIIRCVETSGTECTASIDMKFAAKKWSGDFRPLEIKTLKVNAAGEVKEVTLMEE
jgi:alpha-mannosidase